MTPYYQDDAGLCRCGCGQKTRIAPQTVKKRGWVKGQPVPFVSGHNAKGQAKTAEHLRKISEGQRRAWATTRLRHPLGSKNKDAHGYVRVKTHHGMGGKWAKEHTLVMEQVLGRPMRPGEHVHHINGDRADNSPDNLFACSKADHASAHGSFEALLGGLLRDGIVRFDRATGRYFRCR